MPYAIYTQGFAMPHIAAGINLNLPVVGPLLRKGGAFFMRRSFRGSALYTAVFMNYLGAIMARGHPLQYFIEGGRSRTGRLLAPKTGMLSMTLRSYVRQPRAARGVRARLPRLRAHHRGRQLRRRAVGQGEGEGNAVGLPALAASGCARTSATCT